MATVTEIAEDVYRINVVLPGRRVTFSLFLINDDLPTLVETSFGRVFDEVKEAVGKVLDPRELRHIIVPHFEGDECGALKKFLDIAPNAVPVCSPTGASSVGDFAEQDPQTVVDGEVLCIGSRRLRFILTPYVHLWDSLVVYEETQGAWAEWREKSTTHSIAVSDAGQALSNERSAAQQSVFNASNPIDITQYDGKIISKTVNITATVLGDDDSTSEQDLVVNLTRTELTGADGDNVSGRWIIAGIGAS